MVIGKAGEVCGRVDKLTPIEKKNQWVKSRRLKNNKNQSQINARIIQQQKQYLKKRQNKSKALTITDRKLPKYQQYFSFKPANSNIIIHRKIRKKYFISNLCFHSFNTFSVFQSEILK